MCLQSEQASSLSLSQKQMAAFSGHLGFGLALDQVSPAQPSQTVTTEDRQFQRVRVLVGSKNRLLCSAVYRRSPRRPEVPGGKEAAVLQPCLNHPGFLVHCYCVCVVREQPCGDNPLFIPFTWVHRAGPAQPSSAEPSHWLQGSVWVWCLQLW